MEETKVEVNAAEEKPAKRPYNRQKKTETEVKVETSEVMKNPETIKVEVAEERAKTEVKVANEAEQKVSKVEETKEEVKAEKPAEPKEKPAKPAEELAKPEEKPVEDTAVLSIEKPEIGSDEPNLKASYVIRKPVMIYFVPKVSERYKMFVGVIRVLDKVNNKFVKIAYRDSGTGKDITAYILTSVLPQ